jgi:hypothetical protein
MTATALSLPGCAAAGWSEPSMEIPDQFQRKRSGATGGFKSPASQENSNATERENPPEEALAGGLGHQEDDCSESYSTQQHNFSDAEASAPEQSPSTGWRGVYDAMEVSVR